MPMQAYDSFPEAVLVIDRDGTTTYANRKAARLLGYEQRELLGLDVEILFPGVQAKWVRSSLEALPRTSAERRQLRARARDGQELELEISIGCLGEAHGILALHDVTELIRARKGLRASEERFRMVAEHTSDAAELVARQQPERALAEVHALKTQLEPKGKDLQHGIRAGHNFDEILGTSAALQPALKRVLQVAGTDVSVLLQGETGTGKELMARAIHSLSKRSDRPLIKVDCTTLPPTLFESELFGYEKGAFTGAHESRSGRFELADGGTLFLDEIGELPLDLQPKLLRVIQEGEIDRLGSKKVRKVNVRVIAATNRNLRAEMRAGRFRADLYYRLSVFPIELPPLRERGEDIPQLAERFVSQRARALGRHVDRIPTETLDQLMAYDWPGNVRELQNVLERALVLSSGRDLILAESLAPSEGQDFAPGGLLRRDLARIERQQIIDALEASHWKIKGDRNAASRLGLKASTLRSRMKRLGIQRMV
jgi:PAS domain S-box-containing protein